MKKVDKIIVITVCCGFFFIVILVLICNLLDKRVDKVNKEESRKAQEKESNDSQR